MDRRTVLVSLAGTAALAGCLGSAPTGSDRLGIDADDIDEPDNPTHTVSIASVDTVPGEYDLAFDVDLLVERIGPGETARVAVTPTNTGSARMISIEDGQCGLFDRTDGVSVDGGLVLKREAVADPDNRDGERWTRDADPDEPRAYDSYGCSGREYDAGESVTNTYAVWDDFQTESYLEADTYRFENEIAIATDERNVWDDPDETFVWGFDLEVTPVDTDDSGNE